MLCVAFLPAWGLCLDNFHHCCFLFLKAHHRVLKILINHFFLLKWYTVNIYLASSKYFLINLSLLRPRIL